MPNQTGSGADRTRIVFSAEYQIEYSKLKIAIGGGIKKGSLGAATPEDREEITSQTYLALARFVAKRKQLRGEMSSLAYAIAYNKTRDIFRRRSADALDQHRSSNAPEVELSDRPCAHMTAHQRYEQKQFLLKTWSLLAQDDRKVLLQMCGRDAAMPRKTSEERKAANRVAQAETRARRRLSAAASSLVR